MQMLPRLSLARLSFVALLACTGLAHADGLVGPRLAAATNFAQTWDPVILKVADENGIHDLRDAVYWHNVIGPDGKPRFTSFRTQFPALLAARGMEMTAIVNEGHPDHDAGVTPHSPDAVAAFADFTALIAARFDAITAIEVGNEMNSDTFTSGPMRAADLAGKAAIYTALLSATRAAVHDVRPGLPILGAAAHSIPVAWFRALDDAGAAAHMDAFVVHPYTTAPEQFARQIALVRALPGFAEMPAEATEFGDTNPDTAPATLLKFYCQMALSNVSRAIWYPLNERGDGLAPLIGPGAELSAVGQTYRLIADHLVGQPVQDAAPDPFTYGCQFGTQALVIWGAPRAVTLAPGLRALGPDGQSTAPELSRETPLLILSEGLSGGPDVTLGGSVTLGPHGILADSFDQFAYPGFGIDAFERFARGDGRDMPFGLREGQERGGVPWTPYLGLAEDGGLRMDAEFLLPVSWADIVHRYYADDAQKVVPEIWLAPGANSTDGLTVALEHNGQQVAAEVITTETRRELPTITLETGDILEFIVGTGASDHGDFARYRFILRTPQPAP